MEPPAAESAEVTAFTASGNHSRALNWAWRAVVLPEYAPTHALAAVLDSDVFPLGPFSFRRRLSPAPAAGLPAGGCGLRGVLLGRPDCIGRCAAGSFAAFLHPVYVVVDLRAAPAPHEISFEPVVYQVRGGARVLCAECKPARGGVE